MPVVTIEMWEGRSVDRNGILSSDLPPEKPHTRRP